MRAAILAVAILAVLGCEAEGVADGADGAGGDAGETRGVAVPDEVNGFTGLRGVMVCPVPIPSADPDCTRTGCDTGCVETPCVTSRGDAIGCVVGYACPADGSEPYVFSVWSADAFHDDVLVCSIAE